MAAVKSRSTIFNACPAIVLKNMDAWSEMQKESKRACFPKVLGIQKADVNESAEYPMTLAFV